MHHGLWCLITIDLRVRGAGCKIHMLIPQSKHIKINDGINIALACTVTAAVNTVNTSYGLLIYTSALQNCGASGLIHLKLQLIRK